MLPYRCLTTSTRAPIISELLAACSRRQHISRRPFHLLRQARRPLPNNPQQQRRNKGTFAGNAKKLFLSNPFSVSLAFIIILGGIGTLGLANWIYYNEHLALHNYPEEVAKKLRRAIHYTIIEFDVENAVKYYKEAIFKAEEMGMDAWSDEVIGIKVAISGLMERIGQYEKQATAYEVIRRDCLQKSKEFAADRKKDSIRLLDWATSFSVKLGEIYSRPEVWNREAAERHLSWAVTTMIQERQRRNTNKLTDEEEGPWKSNEEIAATIEGLAHNYEEKDQHYLAAPLFLHAINLHPVKSCHSVTLMNNLASSLAQQSPRAATAVQTQADANTITEQSPRKVSRELLLQMAQTWAGNALNVAGSIAPPERTEECDIGCAVTLHNLGEIAEMTKDIVKAKQHYTEAISVAKAVGFQDGVINSTARLRKLEQSG